MYFAVCRFQNNNWFVVSTFHSIYLAKEVLVILSADNFVHSVVPVECDFEYGTLLAVSENRRYIQLSAD